MDREVTESTKCGFFIVYLFSRNAKKLHLSIELGATQFEHLYGANNKTTKKIIKAKQEFASSFNKYAPSGTFDEMDLMDEEDKDFVRKETPAIKRRADWYAAGCFFTKTYDLVKPNFDEEDLVNDLRTYIDSYRKIVNDPVSSALLEVLDESVFEESDKEQIQDLDYDLPNFKPSKNDKTPKKSSKKSTSKPRKPAPPSKKVGDAGEKYVYDYEFNKLSKCGRTDLANKIVKQHEDLSHFPGYDIQSFGKDGEKIFIEVKSSKSKKKGYFEISKNELSAAEELKDAYYIYQVTSALTNPKISTVIKNPMRFKNENKILVEPLVYRVSFKQQDKSD